MKNEHAQPGRCAAPTHCGLVRRRAAAPEWLVYDQIRNALHLASRERSFGMFHAAAFATRGLGCLITGKSGSGKSTLTAAAVRGASRWPATILSYRDDGPPRVHAVFDTIKLDERGLTEFPRYRPYIRNPPASRGGQGDHASL